MSAAAGPHNAAKYHKPAGENRLATKTALPTLHAMAGFTPSNRTTSRFAFAQPLSAAAVPFRPAGAGPASQRKSRRNTRRNRQNTRRANRR
jgi:hypothetical protein